MMQGQFSSSSSSPPPTSSSLTSSPPPTSSSLTSSPPPTSSSLTSSPPPQKHHHHTNTTTTTIPFAPDDAIGDLKKLVAVQTGTRPDKIVLKKWCTIFRDHVTSADYELHDGMN